MFMNSRIKTISEVPASCLLSRYLGKQPPLPWNSPCFLAHPSAASPIVLPPAWWGWWNVEVLRFKKACDSVRGWKQFFCQNVKTGDIFGINLFPRLSRILSVAMRMDLMLFKYAQFRLYASSQLSDGASQSRALFPACQSDFNSQCIYLSLFTPAPLPFLSSFRGPMSKDALG